MSPLAYAQQCFHRHLLPKTKQIVSKKRHRLRREHDKQATAARHQVEQLRVEYLAREEKFTLDGDRKELLHIKRELDDLRAGIRPGRGAGKHGSDGDQDNNNANSGRSRHQSIDIEEEKGGGAPSLSSSSSSAALGAPSSVGAFGEGGGFGGGSNPLAASMDSLSGGVAPPIVDLGHDDNEALVSDPTTAAGSAPLNLRASGDGDDVRASAGDLATLMRQGDALTGQSGYQPGDPLMREIDRQKQNLEQKEFGS